MIVTCPGCASNYRVRNEAVPSDGARMRCPKCSTMFLAKPPSAEDLADPQTPPPGAASAPPSSAFAAPPSSNPFAGVPASPNPFAPIGTTPPPVTVPPVAPPSSAPPAQQVPSPVTGIFDAYRPQNAPPPAAPPASPFAPAPVSNPFAPPPGSNPFAGRPATGALPAAGLPLASPPGSSPHNPSSFTAPPGAAPFTTPATGASANDPFAASSLASSPTAPPSALDDDPFANLDLDAPARPSMPLGSRAGAAPGPPERSRPPWPPPEESEPSAAFGRARPGPAAASSPLPTPPPTRAPLGATPPPPSLAARLGSWAALVLSSLLAVLGLGFAAWSSGAVDLDEALMARFEARLDVSPPRSFLGKDDPVPQDLQIAAAAARDRGDLAAEAVALRRLVRAAPDDLQARQRLLEALRSVGDARLAEELAGR